VAEGVELTPVAQEAFDVLLGILNRMEFGVEVVADEDFLNVTFDIRSEIFHPILVCRDLEVLNALEQLVDRMIFQEGEDDRLRFHVDSQGVKEQKDLDLSQAALDMAEEAIAKGSTMKIGPLDSRARRMVHLALKEHGGVTTHSEGQGAFRRVCIVPNEE
jgi:spoIIIJ-associated protein